MLIDRGKTSLLLVDVQDRLLPAMAAADQVVRQCGILLKAARALEVPMTVSEQYPRGLGHTVSGLAAEIGNAPVFEKLAFSCWRDEALKRFLIGHYESGRPQVIIAGIEAHVCVLQTAVDLAQAGFAVFAVADAVSSRAAASVDLALSRMRQAGVQTVNTEMAVFELIGKAGSAEFKALSALIR
jgi:nicotinamidase-related amidase